MDNIKKNIRIAVNITEYQNNLINLLIKEHYAETGVQLSKSQFVMIHLRKSLEIARDFIQKEEH